MSGVQCVSGINYVPEHLPDELFYSLISRIQLLNCLPDPKATLKLLFGSTSVISSIDLPSHLDAFQQKLGALSPFTNVATLIENATSYPYFRAFLSPERHKQINLRMVNTQGSGLKTAIGMVANRFGASPELKVCTDCWREDIINYGTPYWHRAHHLPSVSFCIKHEQSLKVISVQSRLDNRHALLTPALFSPDLIKPDDTCSKAPIAIWFAKLSNDLLNSKLENLEPEQRKVVYWHGLENKHLTKGCQQVQWKKLSSNICDFYDDFNWTVYRERLFSTEKHPLRWLNDLIQRPQQAVHPVCHLLLIGYLFESLDVFVECLNNYKSPELNTKKIVSCKPFEEIESAVLLDTTISCRQIAKLHDVSINYVVQIRRLMGIPITERRKSLSPFVIESIKRDLLTGLAVKEVASKNHISVISVYRVLQISIDILKYRRDMYNKIERDTQRSRWRQLSVNNDKATIKVNVHAPTQAKAMEPNFADAEQ